VGSRLLKKPISGVLASLRGSAYRLGKRLFTQAMGGRVKKLRLASSLAAALLNRLFEYPEGMLVSAPN
jgi:hypothetical protein